MRRPACVDPTKVIEQCIKLEESIIQIVFVEYAWAFPENMIAILTSRCDNSDAI